jgi:hypothetical protein
MSLWTRAASLRGLVGVVCGAVGVAACQAPVWTEEQHGAGSRSAASELAAASQLSKDGVDRALLIRDPGVLDALASEFDMGVLLGRVAAMENSLPGVPTRTVGTWVARAFEMAHEDQTNYAASSLGLGPAADSDRTMEAVLRNWRNRKGQSVGIEALRAMTTPRELGGTTFRLLAVTNRMDLAGDFDERMTNQATHAPRQLGEVHMLYGLVDPAFERMGKAFPMTFVLSYRLPALRSGADGVMRAPSGLDMWSLQDPALWREEMKRWAELWAGLATLDLGSSAYRNQLSSMLELAVREENFLGMRSNTKILDDEFELRGWYIFKSGGLDDPAGAPNGQLIPRKPRREPYPCLAHSAALTKQIQEHWVEGDGDLDMTTRLNLPKDQRNNHRRAGYALMRDHTDPYFEGTYTDANNNYRWLKGSCGKDVTEMPYRMLQGPGLGPKPPLLDKAQDKLIFLAPFARVRGAGRVWQLPASVTEAQRHAFAIRTCSGCHGQEGATRGFHVTPRLAHESASLSPYLTGDAGNSFTKELEGSSASVTYRYNLLETRRRWLNQVLNGTATLHDSLKRPER